MADKLDAGILYKKEIKLPPSFGDWTTYKPPKSPAKKIKALAYGSQRVSRESLESILIIHHFFAIEFARHLKESLKASTDVISVTLEQITYLDFLKRVSGGIIYNKLTLGEAGEAMFLVDYQMANIAINFSLGFQTADTKVKELTELEESLINSIFSTIMEKYAKCWHNIFEAPSFEIVSYPNIQRETHLNLNEIVTVITTQLSVANALPATYTFVFQNSLIKKLMDAFSDKNENAPLNLSVLSDALLNAIRVPIIAQAGSTFITTEEVMSLEEDDVISLDQPVNEPVRLIFGYLAEAKAQPGVKSGKLAVRLLSGKAKKIKSSAVMTAEKEITEEIPLAEGSAAPEQQTPEQQNAEKDEDFDLPLEEEGKEAYNEPLENMFEEENNNPGPGGQ